MLRTSVYRWVIVSVSCASLLAPSPSYGFCCGLFGSKPAAPALACNPCGVQQTVSYVPQTCYRTQYVTVPVTTYRPAVSCNPCGGCPVTTMRPVVTNVQKAVLVPYTTYRLVYSNAVQTCAPPVAATGYAPVAYAPTPTYAAPAAYAAPATYAAPAVGYAAPAVGGCGPCGASTAGYAAPAMGGCSSCGPVATTYAPRMSTPMYAAPSYAAPAGSPIYSAPSGTIPTYSQPTGPTYGQPTGPTYGQPTVPTYGQPAVPSYSQPSYGQPSVPTYSPPSYTAPGTPSIGPATSTPSLSPTPGGPSTPSNTLKPAMPLKPIPDPNISGDSRVSPSSTSPRLVDPDNRTTSIPVYRPWAYSTVAWPNNPPVDVAIRTVSATQEQPVAVEKPAKPTRRPLAQDDGWRPSSR